MTWIRIVRIVLLLCVFAAMAFYAKTQKLKVRSWATPLEIVIYPINGDNQSKVVNQYINDLDSEVFAHIDAFIQRESQRYGQIIQRPTITRLGAKIDEKPPASPTPDSNFIRIIRWGLKFRYWAFVNTPDSESNLHRVRVFVHYHEVLDGRKLQHSLGLDKGLLAVVHAFAAINQDQQNNVVIAHEILHTVGATDKYGKNGEPIMPQGYASPSQQPLYPQTKAEIMAARIPLTPTSSRMAENLDEVVIGKQTAEEINWLMIDQ